MEPLAGGVVKGAAGGVMLLLFIRVFWHPIPYILVFGGIALGLLSFLAFAAVATIAPMLRAFRIDPAAALRTE